MVYWEYKLPSDNTALLAVVPKKDKPHVVLPGLHILDCNYGPERNKWNNRKAAEGREKKQNVDHSQASVCLKFTSSVDTKSTVLHGSV